MKEIFELQNPWRQPGYRFLPEKMIPRHLQKELYASLSKPEISVLLGARQVGKTFLLHRLIQTMLENDGYDPCQIFYFNLDAFSLLPLVQDIPQFLRFIEAFGVAGKPSFVFLDESQRLPNCGLLLKQYHDLGRPIKFIVSGSSALEIKSQVRESLIGRKQLFHLASVSFAEAAAYWGFNFSEAPLAQLPFENGHALPLLQRYLKHGGYPAVVAAGTEEERTATLRELYQSYIQKDVSDFLKVEDVAGFNRLVSQLSPATAQLLNVHELSKLTRLSRYFVDKYLQMLRDTYVVELLFPYFSNAAKAVIKTPKLFFYDLGMRNALHYQFQIPQQLPDEGHLAENLAFTTLRDFLPAGNLWFWRTTQATEIDFIYEAGGKIYPLEVKFKDNEPATIPKAIRTFAEAHALHHAVVLTKNLWEEKREDKLTVSFVPVWAASRLREILPLS